LGAGSGVDGGGGGMARWGVLGGRGWFRLAQQNTTCELNSMPQFGDYWSWEGIGQSALIGIPTGCMGALELSEKVPLLAAWNPFKTCALGAAVGAVGSIAIYLLIKRDIYKTEKARWCRENYTNCKNNEYYLDACDEIVNPQ